MILSGAEIIRQIKLGNIVINPFNLNNVNSNSYNITLNNKFIEYKHKTLDIKKMEPYKTFTIDENKGFLLKPGHLYLGQTLEHTETYNYIPMIEGRSSLGRLGIFIHVTAGFGDINFKGRWTLEIVCVKPVRIYPFIQIGQLYYHSVLGEIKEELKYNGKYQDCDDIKTSRIYQEFL